MNSDKWGGGGDREVNGRGGGSNQTSQSLKNKFPPQRNRYAIIIIITMIIINFCRRVVPVGIWVLGYRPLRNVKSNMWFKMIEFFKIEKMYSFNLNQLHLLGRWSWQQFYSRIDSKVFVGATRASSVSHAERNAEVEVTRSHLTVFVS